MEVCRHEKVLWSNILKEKELPCAGFEPTTLLFRHEFSTNLATKAAQQVGVQITNTSAKAQQALTYYVGVDQGN